MTASGVPGPDHAPDLAEAEEKVRAFLGRHGDDNIERVMDEYYRMRAENEHLRDDLYVAQHHRQKLRADRDRLAKALADAVFGLDRAAEMAAKDPTVRRDFEELAARARDALAREPDPTRKDEG